MDTRAKSVQLLERIANSVHERDPKTPTLLCFSSNEVHVVDEWLQALIWDLIKELQQLGDEK